MRNRLMIALFVLTITVCTALSLTARTGGLSAGTLSVQALSGQLPRMSLTAADGVSALSDASDPDSVLVILDAGHGGMDGGAVGVSGLLEKEVNLAVTRTTSELLTLLGIPVSLTRSEDTDLSGLAEDAKATVRERKRLDLKKRVELVNRCSNALLVSIHMNNFTQPQYSGAQVFYTTACGDMKALGESLQTTLAAALDPSNTRLAKPAEGDIYLLEHSTRPAILMEGGFLSNAAEEARLRTDGYRTKMAAVLASVLCSYRPDGL